jgi:hypothetical protein
LIDSLFIVYDADNYPPASQKLRNSLLDSAKRSRQAQLEVDARWPVLVDMTLPQDVYVSMTEQQAACEKVLGIKDEVISAMRDMLAKKDSEFTRALSAQAQAGSSTTHVGEMTAISAAVL